jgi:type IV pilus assembly protein PilC
MSSFSPLFRWVQTRPLAWLAPRTRTDALVARMLASALEQGRGTSTVLEALARDSTIWTPPQLQRLAWAIEAGVPLAEGVRSSPHALRPETRRAVLLGEETGTTVEQLRLIASLLERPPAEQFHSRPMLFPYVVTVLVVASYILSFLGYYIMPKIKRIFHDFGVELPLATRLCLDASDLVVNYFYLGGLAFLVVGWLWRAGRSRESALWNLGRAMWWLPWHDPRRATPGLLRQAVIAMDRGVTLSGMFAALPMSTTESWLKDAFNRIRRGLEEGTPLWDLLAGEGFLAPSEAAVLKSAADVGNERWIALGLADTLEQRLGFKQAVRLELVNPLVTLGMGAVVALIAVAYFLPLVKLMNDLS